MARRKRVEDLQVGDVVVLKDGGWYRITGFDEPTGNWVYPFGDSDSADDELPLELLRTQIVEVE